MSRAVAGSEFNFYKEKRLFLYRREKLVNTKILHNARIYSLIDSLRIFLDASCIINFLRTTAGPPTSAMSFTFADA